MILAQSWKAKRHLVFAVPATIMASAALLNPHSSPDAFGGSPQSAKDKWIETTVAACEAKKDQEAKSAALTRGVMYSTTLAMDASGGGGLFSFLAVIGDTIYTVLSPPPIHCERTAKKQADEMNWAPSDDWDSRFEDSNTIEVRNNVPMKPSSLLLTPVAQPTIETLSEQNRAFIREFKSAMVIRGHQLARKTRNGLDRGALHRELVKFMDSVPNDQWGKENNQRFMARINEIAKIDPLAKQELRRIHRKVESDFRQVQPVTNFHADIG